MRARNGWRNWRGWPLTDRHWLASPRSMAFQAVPFIRELTAWKAMLLVFAFMIA